MVIQSGTRAFQITWQTIHPVPDPHPGFAGRMIHTGIAKTDHQSAGHPYR